ncbi:MAG TPA: J domain-containing protein [Candidatus Binataceae bacterium]|nr:J domain-containing protein [Candidatus Binataceae bacterium]
MQNESSYPLAWPAGPPRTEPSKRRCAAFGAKPSPSDRVRALTLAEAAARLQSELDRLGAEHPVLSTNIALRVDGRPRSDQHAPDDPGAAIYFTLKGRRTVLACDRWIRVADNIAAIAAHIGALRGIERWGVGTIEQAFRGYRVLEDFRAGIPWRRVFGIDDGAPVTRAAIEARFRELAMRHHPDHGGSHEAMAELTAALADARRELGGGAAG